MKIDRAALGELSTGDICGLIMLLNCNGDSIENVGDKLAALSRELDSRLERVFPTSKIVHSHRTADGGIEHL